METQCKRVYLIPRNVGFLLLLIANLLINSSMYMLVPEFYGPMNIAGLKSVEAAVIAGIFAFGLFSLGCFNNYLIQTYKRRNVCLNALLGLLATVLLTFYILFYGRITDRSLNFIILLILQFAGGALFGLAEMVLYSTLIIDKCESFQRTQANRIAAWSGRFALVTGPFAGILISIHFGSYFVFITSVAMILLSVVLICMIKFPFKTPDDDVKCVSNDRFFLPNSRWMFINVILISVVFGLFIVVGQSESFYVMLLSGLFIAVIIECLLWGKGLLKWEVTFGLLSALVALIFITWGVTIISYDFMLQHHDFFALFLGLGIGIAGSKFLLFFINISKHCQRGTSQSTFFLGWESGIYIGISAGCILYGINNGGKWISHTSIVFVVLALILYLGFIHRWYIRNKVK